VTATNVSLPTLDPRTAETAQSYTPPDFTEPRLNRRRGAWRHLTLLDRHDRPFLVRRGIDVRLFGVFVHEITAPDPGLDMHDHPWVFASWVIRGGYTEKSAEARAPGDVGWRTWRRWSIHRMRQTDIHRIAAVEPRTVTLVVRGRKTRPWGFFVDGQWVDYRDYDYEARRPVSEVRA
jgi:hypothetical protein